MLVLSRRLNEKILLPSIQASVRVVAIKPGSVRLGIEAPADLPVLREEVRDRIAQWAPPRPPAAETTAQACIRQVTRLLCNRLQVAHTGLAQLRRQVREGLREDAEVTLDKLEEDFELLRQRLLPGEPAAPPPPVQQPRRRKALLVEDNANERELLATFLRISGLDVVTAGDGTDAIDYLHGHALPDVVLLDMGLPPCDGATLVRQLRRDPAYARLKIFAVSGHVPEEFDLANGPAGVDRWFQKPIDPAELVRNLDQELNRPMCRV